MQLEIVDTSSLWICLHAISGPFIHKQHLFGPHAGYHVRQKLPALLEVLTTASYQQALVALGRDAEPGLCVRGGLQQRDSNRRDAEPGAYI